MTSPAQDPINHSRLFSPEIAKLSTFQPETNKSLKEKNTFCLCENSFTSRTWGNFEKTLFLKVALSTRIVRTLKVLLSVFSCRSRERNFTCSFCYYSFAGRIPLEDWLLLGSWAHHTSISRALRTCSYFDLLCSARSLPLLLRTYWKGLWVREASVRGIFPCTDMSLWCHQTKLSFMVIQTSWLYGGFCEYLSLRSISSD